MSKKAKVIKVYTDDSEVLYINGDLVFDKTTEIETNVLMKVLIGYEILDFKIYYIKPEVFKSDYNNIYPDDLNDFKYSHLL